MRELKYPFDAEKIIKKKKSIKRNLLEDSSKIFIEKKIAILGGETTENIKLILEIFLLNYGIKPYFYEVEVNLFLCPLSPALWDRIKNGDGSGEYYIFDELETSTNEIAKKYNLKITGSYNLYNLNIKNEDFYDVRHLRHEQLSKFFYFTSKAGNEKGQQYKLDI